ncbi:sulfur carrier protein ThiS [Kistimonas asteriae]|uniref:sulfur carrier protein ThiS n=1 Tax=Kistimonas asteriae TaxID=517724 RepID=UPI001BA43CA2|nr:sulfur carrier protein ThiS [Kistimonas asteriae]
MNITVNNQPYRSEGRLSLGQLLADLAIEDNGIAVAVNEDIVSRSLWDGQNLCDGDRVIVIKATAGG